MPIKPKKKICVSCNTEQFIFSKGMCKGCASKTYKKPEYKPLQARTPLKVGKGLSKGKRHSDANKKLREGYAEFFQKHISIIKSGKRTCANCGDRLQGIAGEVAHILDKQMHPEISTDDQNVIYLCMWGNGCHNIFDSFHENRKKMKIYLQVRKKVLSLSKKLEYKTETIKKYLTDEEI